MCRSIPAPRLLTDYLQSVCGDEVGRGTGQKLLKGDFLHFEDTILIFFYLGAITDFGALVELSTRVKYPTGKSKFAPGPHPFQDKNRSFCSHCTAAHIILQRDWQVHSR